MDVAFQPSGGDGDRRPGDSMRRMLRCSVHPLLSLCCCLTVIGCGSPPPADSAAAADAPATTAAADPAPSAPARPLPATPELPTLAPDQYEWHGHWNGDRFWARLAPHAEDYGGRVLQLLYTQPDPATVDGTMLAPHPWLLLGEDLAISAWLERSRLSRAEYRSDDEPPGYRVTRETERRVGDDVFSDERSLRIAGPRGWDRRVAPLLLSLLWRVDSQGSIPVYDLFAVDPEPVALQWDGPAVTLGEISWQAEPDATGRLQRLLAADGTAILTVEEHLPLLPAAEAIEREQQFLEDLTVD
jgi:hypothetical protein